jgi:hypothetical protein
MSFRDILSCSIGKERYVHRPDGTFSGLDSYILENREREN